jgi:hypothetical protein
MPRRTLFLSHSSPHDSTRIEAVRSALARDSGFEPWLDRRDLAFGQQWYGQVATALAGCDAGVLLLDQAALASDYVRHEASVLGNRVFTEPDSFRLFVAILDPALSRTSLSDSPLRVARIAEEQIWRPSTAELTDDTLLGTTLRQKIEEQIGPPSFLETRRDRIARKLQAVLKHIEAMNADALTDALAAAQQRGSAPDGLETVLENIRGEPRQRLVARWIVAGAASDLKAMLAFLKALWLDSAAQQHTFVYLLRAAESYWLGDVPSPPRACPVCQAMGAAQRGGVVAINGAKVAEYTVRCFAHRALSPDSPFHVITCDDGADVDGVVQSIVSYFKNRRLVGKMDEARIRSLTKMGDPTVCLLPRQFVQGSADIAQLERLRDCFGSILYVLWPGLSMEDGIVPDGVSRIDPPVDAAREIAHWETCDALGDLLGEPE